MCDKQKLKELAKTRVKRYYDTQHEYIIAWLDVYRLGIITRQACITNLAIFRAKSEEESNILLDTYFI